MYRQYTLTSRNTVTTGWIDTPAALKTGTVIERLDQPGSRWRILEVGHIALKTPPRGEWKVGGIHKVTGRS